MRLIDADKLLERMKKGMESGSNLNGTFDLYIEHAPTVKPNGDLISRQAAIRWVKTECNPYGKPTLDFESGKKVIEHLGQMPSADRPTGEWIEVEVLPEVYDIEGVKSWGSKMQCDQCGFIFTAIEGHITQYNFCPNCGADMRGGEDE